MSAARSHIEPNIRTLRILIADDQPIIRQHVRRILEEQHSFSVCGEAYDGAAAIEEAKRLKPDVVVLNVSMPILNGLDAGRKIKVELPKAAIVIYLRMLISISWKKPRKLAPELMSPRAKQPRLWSWQLKEPSPMESSF
jgi:PleD family two-component response regulator